MKRRIFIKVCLTALAGLLVGFKAKPKLKEENVFYVDGIVTEKHIEGYDRIVVAKDSEMQHCTIIKPKDSPYEFFYANGNSKDKSLIYYEGEHPPLHSCVLLESDYYESLKRGEVIDMHGFMA